MSIILRGGQVFDPTIGRLWRADVRIDGDRVAAVGPDLPPGDEREIDLRGSTVLPGLINMHEHLTMRRTWGPPWRQVDLADPYLVIRGVRGALAALRQGITTARELGAKHHLNLYLKRAIAAGLFPGPRIVATGAPISITGGHAWPLCTEADGPEGLRRAVRETIKEGADWIKLISSNDPVHEDHDAQHTHPEFSREELVAAAETAHLRGRRITAHAMGRTTLGWAIDARLDSIEHGVYLDHPLAERMREARIPLIPTLSGYYETILGRWGRGEDWVRRHEQLVEPHKASARIAIDAGVVVGVGTDTVGDIVEELEMLVACGMSNAQVLSAATLTNARILGMDDRLGAVAPGFLADLVVVRGDPLTNVRVMREVEWVFRGGVGWRPSEIALQMEDETADWTSLALLGHN